MLQQAQTTPEQTVRREQREQLKDFPERRFMKAGRDQQSKDVRVDTDAQRQI